VFTQNFAPTIVNVLPPGQPASAAPLSDSVCNKLDSAHAVTARHSGVKSSLQSAAAVPVSSGSNSGLEPRWAALFAARKPRSVDEKVQTMMACSEWKMDKKLQKYVRAHGR
jgi:hypothetical protein